jgi:hypothetical protein
MVKLNDKKLYIDKNGKEYENIWFFIFFIYNCH